MATYNIEIKRGLFANLPTTGNLGEPFFCTDTGQLFVWNGNTMAGIVGAPAGSGTITVADLAAVEGNGTKVQLTNAGATANGDVVTYDASGNVQDSGALLTSLVPTTTTVNGHALTTNVTISASDITTGTLPHGQLPTLLSGDIPANAANTSGSSAKWTTARNLAGNSVDGSGNVTFSNKVIVQGTADAGLSAAQFLGALGTGIVKNTITTGILTIAVAGDFPTLNQNTSGTAANLSGTPALPNGTTATTQAAADASTKLATTAYVDRRFIAGGTATLGTSAISSGAKATLVTVSATGTLTTDTVIADFNADPSAVTGYAPSASGMLTIIKFCTADNVNFYVYNNTGASITPGAITLNWRVVR